MGENITILIRIKLHSIRNKVLSLPKHVMLCGILTSRSFHYANIWAECSSRLKKMNNIKIFNTYFRHAYLIIFFWMIVVSRYFNSNCHFQTIACKYGILRFCLLPATFAFNYYLKKHDFDRLFTISLSQVYTILAKAQLRNIYIKQKNTYFACRQ